MSQRNLQHTVQKKHVIPAHTTPPRQKKKTKNPHVAGRSAFLCGKGSCAERRWVETGLFPQIALIFYLSENGSPKRRHLRETGGFLQAHPVPLHKSASRLFSPDHLSLPLSSRLWHLGRRQAGPRAGREAWAPPTGSWGERQALSNQPETFQIKSGIFL